MKSDSLQGILPFVHAVEAGSFTRAGERLHVTTSAIGKSIAQLEQRLGVRLLHRSTRRLSLTGEGEAYYESCTAALAQIDAAQALLASRRQVPSGRLRVDLPLAFGRRCVAPVLFDVLGKFPDIVPDISFNDRRIDLIEEGIDLVVRMGETRDAAGLIARRLFVQRYALCAAPKYLERHGRPKDIRSLAGHSLIVYGRDGHVTPWRAKDSDGQIRTIKPRGNIVLGHGEPMLDAAMAGLGLASLPSWLISDSLKRGKLELVWPNGWVEGAAVYALWPKTRDPAPKIRVVVDALTKRFSSPPWDAS